MLLWTGEMGGRVNLARWQALCPNLNLVTVAGEHPKLLEGASLDIVAKALVNAMRVTIGDSTGLEPEPSLSTDTR